MKTMLSKDYYAFLMSSINNQTVVRCPSVQDFDGCHQGLSECSFFCPELFYPVLLCGSWVEILGSRIESWVAEIKIPANVMA